MSQISKNKLVDMDDSHFDLLLYWRNQDHIRKVMFEDKVIIPSEHEKWFTKIQHDQHSYVKIFYFENTPLGMVNIKMDEPNNICHWGFYIGEKNAPKGSGTRLGFLALSFIFEELKIRKLCAEVLGINEKSIHFHKKLGFKQEGVLQDQLIRNKEYVDVVLMALFDHSWGKQKEKINNFIEGQNN